MKIQWKYRRILLYSPENKNCNLFDIMKDWGKEGWEFIGIFDERAYFKKQF